MANTTLPINTNTDTVGETVSVTSGYFTDGVGKLEALNIYSGSLSATQQKFYQTITQTHPESASAATQFSVAYGHYAGSGSYTDGGNIIGASELVYKQWANLLLPTNEATGGFKISKEGSGGVHYSTGNKDDYIYVLIAKRSLFKDRLNKKNWTIALSGSNQNTISAGVMTAGASVSGSLLISLTDDSATKAPVATPVGNRYNIVSGSLGGVQSAASTKTYGWFYPDMGVMVFSGAELSASIPGAYLNAAAGNDVTASFASTHETTLDTGKLYTGSAAVQGYISSSGFGPNLTSAYDPKNALRFVNCLQPGGAYMQFRGEEDQNSVSYFCRVFANDMNYSNNSTFVSGSQNKVRHPGMKDDPNVFITGVNLYSGDGELVACAKLSSPIKKNFSTEATIKVKLTY